MPKTNRLSRKTRKTPYTKATSRPSIKEEIAFDKHGVLTTFDSYHDVFHIPKPGCQDGDEKLEQKCRIQVSVILSYSSTNTNIYY